MSGTSQRFVAYERVSTNRQGASGLGLDAQRKSIDDSVASRGAEVIGRFTEVESGKLANMGMTAQ
jgi:DNA invertase Pin-like site-specific DNA recombinase